MLIGPFFGALVGVYLGFKINDKHRRELEEEKRGISARPKIYLAIICADRDSNPSLGVGNA